MKRILLTVLIAISMLMTVGAASAEDLVVTNNDAVECGDILVNLTCEGANITVLLDTDYGISEGVDDNPGIEKIYLNLTDGVSVTDFVYDSVTSTDIATDSFNVDGFGHFNTELSLPTDSVNRTAGPVTIHLSESGCSALEVNEDERYIALHIISLGEEGVSTFVTNGECGGGGIEEIPEFPTIALPVAAIVGLAFLIQRRKE